MAYFNPYVQMLDQANAAPVAGFASGFMQGGPVGGIIGGISGVIKRRNAYRQADEALDALEPDSLVDTDIYGRPVFNSAEALQQTANINDLNRAAGRKRRGLRKLFRSNDDVILGAKMDMKSQALQTGLQDERNKFNSQMEDYNAQQLAMSQYNQMLNNTNRLNNLYNIGTSLY